MRAGETSSSVMARAHEAMRDLDALDRRFSKAA